MEERNSASASQSDSGSNAGSRMEASSPFDEDEDDEDEDEDGDEDLVEEEAPIDWSAIDANAFFQNWLLPGGMGEQQEQPPSGQQMTSANFGTSLPPQQMYTPNGSVAPVPHIPHGHQQQSQQHQQQQEHSAPAASPNLSAAIEILTKVLGEGQEVPSQVLEMLLQSVAPTLGYQPPTPSQEPGIDSLVPILKDLIKKQQQQEQQQQMLNESANLGGNPVGGGQQPWPSVIPQPRTSAVGPSPMPNVSYSSMTPHHQPFNWIPLATPADDDEEDDEDKDPSYNPTTLTGALGIQDALQEQMSQYLNSPFAVTPTGATSNRPSPLPQPVSMPPPNHASATTSVRSSPRKAQGLHRRLSAGSGSGKQSAATTARTGIHSAGPVSPSPATESRLGPRAEARQRASENLRAENEADTSWSAGGGGATGSKSKKRGRADTHDSEDERREPGHHQNDTPPRRSTARQADKPRPSKSSSKRSARGRNEEDEEGDAFTHSPSRSASPSRFSLDGRTDSPTPSPVKKPSNAGRKPIFDTEEERKAKRAEQNRLYQQEYRARKRAEKDKRADRRAGAPLAVTASATIKGRPTTAAASAGQNKGGQNGNSKSVPKSASSATALGDAARLREDYEEVREENAELKGEQRLLRAEMERLRRENVELRVEVEVSRRLALGGGSNGNNSSSAHGSARVAARSRRNAASSTARRTHRRPELEEEEEEDAPSTDQEGPARSEGSSDSEPEDRDASGFSRRRGDGRPLSNVADRRTSGNSHPSRERDRDRVRERERERDRGSGRPHAPSRGYR